MTGRRKGTPCACKTDPCSCGSSKGKCIRTINNLSPDPNGDFFIEAGSGITITQTGDNSFEVSFDGTFPSNPLIYKGTVGSGGTVAVLPAADPDNIGWTYIAIEAATSPVTYEVGDVLISDGYTWQVVPSGDEIVPIVTAWQATPDDQHVPSEKLVKDSLDAKLDKITTGANPRVYAHTGGYQHDIQCASAASTGTVMLRDANARAYGDDPADDNDLLCLVNVNTLKTKLNDVVYKSTAQTITATKTFTAVQIFRKDDDNIILSNPNFTVGTLPLSDKYNSILFRGAGITNIGYITQGYHIDGSGTIALRTYTYDQNNNAEFQIHVNSSQKWMSGPNRTYNASNTTDVVNIALLDAYTPMVRTTGNQTIAGEKKFTSPIAGVNVLGFFETSGSRPAGTYQLLMIIPRNEIINSPTRSHLLIEVGVRGGASGFDVIDIGFNAKNATSIAMAWPKGLNHTVTYVLSQDTDNVYFSRINIGNNNDGIVVNIFGSTGISFSGTFGTISTTDLATATVAGTEVARVSNT